MGSPGGETGKEEGRFDTIMMIAAVGSRVQKKSSSSGRVDMVSKIDLSVKLDEDSIDEDEEMESSELPSDDVQTGPRCLVPSVIVKDEEASSPQPQFPAPSKRSGFPFKREASEAFGEQALMRHIIATGSDRSTVEDEESPSSSPNASLSASAATQLKHEVMPQNSCISTSL